MFPAKKFVNRVTSISLKREEGERNSGYAGNDKRTGRKRREDKRTGREREMRGGENCKVGNEKTIPEDNTQPTNFQG